MKQSRLVVLLMLVWAIASGGVEKTTMRVTVLESETQSIALSGSSVPRNCDPTNYDAYCHSSKTTETTNTLVVQEGSQEPLRLSCTVEAKWSRCVPLQKGMAFDARREKNGLLIYYLDDKGKLRKQLYTYVGGEKATGASVAPANSRASEPQTPAAMASADSQAADSPQEVKCNFSSTPGGAEIQVDGKYVGSTPSALQVSLGKHTIEISLPGFAGWKRELTVEAGSQLTVNAVLEKAQ